MKKIYLSIALIFFFFSIASLLSKGFFTLPTEGDSVNMHIPIAKSILTGDFIYLDKTRDIFYPAATETLLSLFMVLKIPLNLFNVVGIISAFVLSVVLGVNTGLDRKMAVWFGLSVFFLYGISRWSLTQKPDVWMLVSFIFILLFCFKKVVKDIDYLWLGIFSGFFIGSKFTGPAFMIIVLLFFYKKFFTSINLRKGIYFLIPFFVLGVFWYLRNFMITGNPFYFQGYSALSVSTGNGLLAWHAWQSILFHTQDMLNAFLSEFMLWSIGIILIPIFIFIHRKDKAILEIKKIVYISVLFFTIYLFLPASDNLTQMIGSLRYVFPAIYLIILSLFMIGDKYKKNDFIIIFAFSNIVLLLLPSYHPKLLFPIFLTLLSLEFVLKNKSIGMIKA